MSEKTLSIVIPVFNKWNFTKSCLNDLSKLPNTHEIIVVDNGSTDQTQSELANSTEIVYHRLPDNMGFGFACNRGQKLSSSPSVLFLNNDVKVRANHENWTAPLTAAMTDANLVGPTGGFVDPQRKYEFIYETSDPNKKLNYMSGWCLGAKKSVWNKLVLEGQEGSFDSARYFCFFEDTDLSMRAAQLDISFQLVPIDVVHFGHTTAKTLNMSKLYLESKKAFCERWK